MQKRIFLVPLLWALAWDSCSGDPANHSDERYAAMSGPERDIRAALVAFALSTAAILITCQIIKFAREVE